MEKSAQRTHLHVVGDRNAGIVQSVSQEALYRARRERGGAAGAGDFVTHQVPEHHHIGIAVMGELGEWAQLVAAPNSADVRQRQMAVDTGRTMPRKMLESRQDMVAPMRVEELGNDEKKEKQS